VSVYNKSICSKKDIYWYIYN